MNREDVIYIAKGLAKWCLEALIVGGIGMATFLAMFISI